MTIATTNSGSGQEAVKDTSSMTVKCPRATALVIDEDFTCRMIEQGFIASLGIDTDAVDSTSKALDLLDSGATFDFILIEKTSKHPDGIEAIREMRDMGVESRIVVVAVEYSDGERDALDFAGADICVAKGFTPAIIAEAFDFEPKSKNWQRV